MKLIEHSINTCDKEFHDCANDDTTISRSSETPTTTIIVTRSTSSSSLIHFFSETPFTVTTNSDVRSCASTFSLSCCVLVSTGVSFSTNRLKLIFLAGGKRV